MLQWLTQTLPFYLEHYRTLAFALVFIGGIITSIGPCNLATIPIVISYVGGQTELDRRKSFYLSLFFVLGTSTTFMLLGVLIALIGGIFGPARSILFYIVAAVCIAVGLSLLRVWHINLPWEAALLKRNSRHKGAFGAYILGLIVGLASNQCGTPVLFVILSLVMLKGSMAYGAALLFFYALGRSIPVIIAGTFTGTLKNMPAITRWSNILEHVAGAAMILAGTYMLWIA
ncbi:MAG: cytochrome c biogenesis CcdA family protein [Candidatus Saccharibacteria bacterium]